MLNKQLYKELAQYPEAMELKELGFDEPCFAVYYLHAVCYHFSKSNGIKNSDKLEKTFHCTSPTYSQAFRWFKDNYNLRENYGAFPHHTIMFNYVLNGGKEEEAELACLRILIEIVKKNNEETNPNHFHSYCLWK